MKCPPKPCCCYIRKLEALRLRYDPNPILMKFLSLTYIDEIISVWGLWQALGAPALEGVGGRGFAPDRGWAGLLAPWSALGIRDKELQKR